MGLVRLQIAGAVVLLVGCGGGGSDKWLKNLPETVDARGVVLLDGKPVEGAAIVLSPKEDGHAAMALSGSGGAFKLKAFPSKNGVVPGSYQVGVTRSEPVGGANKTFDPGPDAAHEAGATVTSVKNVLPEQYADPKKSGLTLTIPEAGASDLKLDLKSAP